LILMLRKLIMKYNICIMFTCVLLIAFCILADVDASDSELLKKLQRTKRSSLTVIKLTDKESLPDIVVENRRAALEFNYGHKMGAESFGYGSVVKIHENEFFPRVLNQWSGSLEGSVGWGHGINFGAYLKPAIIRLGYDESERDLGDHESFPIGISS
ncbi:hypothetical protein T11_18243, partial [Trichinella zimbabwensis]